jgi:hypothetical protein
VSDDGSLTIAPEARNWRGLLRRNDSAEAVRFREQCGLPVDRPVVMTGHQAQVWHPGILAKYIAADAFAECVGAEAHWIVVDQDRPDRIGVRYPVVEPLGNLGVREWVCTERGIEGRADGGGARVEAFVGDGLRSIEQAIGMRKERTLAGRVVSAVAALMAPYMVQRHRTILFATGLHKTDLFAELVDRMRREPERCIRAYNAAAAAHPDAGIRPLVADEVQDRWELPLWRLPPGAPRSRVYAEDLPGVPREQLAPKALLMTGLLRLAGCDLFIHGLGGGGADAHAGYDAVTDAWLRSWLGGVRLAPVVVVSATCRLPLQGSAISPEEIEHAVWRAHHARHIPGELGLLGQEEQRRALVAQIAVAAPHVRRKLYHELHRALEVYRERHARELAELDREAAAARARAGDAAVAEDRTWAFPLYPPELLGDLRDRIAARFRA